jgi:FkbM family methyltransferase
MLYLYWKMSNSQVVSKPKTLRVREGGPDPLLFRPGTTDLKVLLDTFAHKYHLPPIDLRPDCVIVDLGGNVGYTVVHLAFLYPKSRIIAVELDRDNIEIASQNTRFHQERCKLIHAAIWSADGQVQYGGSGEWAFHVVEGHLDDKSNVRQAPARTIDSIFEECNLDTVHYLKMDIEGAEANVFQGPMSWINHVQSIKIEVHPHYNPAATMENCMNALISYGFKCSKDNNHPQCVIGIRE